MNTYANTTGMPTHKDQRLHQWLRQEMDSLSTKKDALDSEYPRYAKHIPSRQMRSIAYQSLLQKICRPPSAPTPE